MTNILSSLNDSQQKAVEHDLGPLLILAGPGSGKTRVIVHRIAYLIRTCGISPHRIMAVTFTNKAANELKERLGTLVSGWADELTVGTFHAICARILRIDGKKIGIKPDFVIYSRDDQVTLVKRTIQEVGYDPSQYSANSIMASIGMVKSQMLSPEEYAKQASSYFEEVVSKVYKRYEELLTQSNALDFDDLLLKTVRLLDNHSDIKKKYQNRYQHIMVDEFQDTNLVQYALVKLFTGKHKNICVVGDPDQSIYSWRSADLRNILNFEEDYKGAKVIHLGQSYRSTKKILKAAVGVISANNQRKPIELWTDNEDGENINVAETFTQHEEARYVVREIERLQKSGKERYGGCAVMYRTNAQSRVLEETFLRYGVPYRLVAGTRFYERREVKDVIAYLRIIQNPDDGVSLLRVINVPPRGLGQKSIQLLANYAKEENISLYEALKHVVSNGGKKPSLTQRAVNSFTSFKEMVDGLIEKKKDAGLVELFDDILQKSGYKEYLLGEKEGQERLENVMELRSVVQEYSEMPPGEGLPAFLEGAALVSDVDGLNGETDAVTLITLHQAKGLEFSTVFIVGAEEGILPHFRSIDDPLQMEEERRLFYVGVTRAKKRLYVLRALSRHLMGGNTSNDASRFINDIPKGVVSGSNGVKEKTSFTRKITSWQEEEETSFNLPDLKSGDRVKHAQFGEGVIVGLKPSKDDAEVQVDFKLAGIKRLMLSFAKLEKVE